METGADAPRKHVVSSFARERGRAPARGKRRETRRGFPRLFGSREERGGG
ncbi:MAG: hypothetical protein BJ554DRAFT_7541, partial [Olpidium bornovanus]